MKRDLNSYWVLKTLQNFRKLLIMECALIILLFSFVNASAMSADSFDDELQQLRVLNSNITSYIELVNSLNINQTNITKSENIINKIGMELAVLVDDYGEQLKQYKKCPVCFQSIPPNLIVDSELISLSWVTNYVNEDTDTYK